MRSASYESARVALPRKNHNGVLLNTLHVDNVNIVVFARPIPDVGNQFAAKELWPAGGFRPTEDTAVDHIAFSYAALDPVFERIKTSGVEIVRGLAVDPDHGVRSFFVRGPDNVLIELVEERPIPEGIWSR
jgi:catechol 2,3-dioxygenase-like lactoylglutathione lyase family enzyme